MNLTLGLSSADAAKLRRLSIVKTAGAARARTQAAKIVWYDGPEHHLAAGGLSLEGQGGTWRMERHWPAPGELWPPGAPARPAGDTEWPEGKQPEHQRPEGKQPEGKQPEYPRPEYLAPVATFEGRRTVFALTMDGAPVGMTLLDGISRAGMAERPAARLTLSGPDAAVRALLTHLTETIALDVPPDSLAMEALSLAAGTAPRARRDGAPVLPGRDMAATVAFAHILGHLTDVLIALAPEAARADSGPEAVHKARVAVRRARSALSLFAATIADPLLPRCAEGFRELSHVLGPARDWDVFMTETLPPVLEALPGQAGLAALARAAARQRTEAHAALTDWLEGPAFRRLVLDLACLSGASQPGASQPGASQPGGGEPDAGGPALKDVAAETLRAAWKKVARAGRSLEDLDNPGLHALRLKAKRLRYAAEFFAPLFPEKAASRFVRRLAALQERLGVFNDSAVVVTLLTHLGRAPNHAAGLVLGFTAANAAGIRPKIAASWSRFRKCATFWG